VSRYLLDTNILSNATKPAPSEALVAWMSGQADKDWFIPCLTVAEIRRGILEKPVEKKRRELEHWFSGPEGPQALFAGRVLPFDAKAGLVCARLDERFVSGVQGCFPAFIFTNRLSAVNQQLGRDTTKWLYHCGACQNAGMLQLEAVYSHLWAAHSDEFSVLDQSLGPRSWTFLFDVAAQAGLGPNSVVTDVGCGRGNHCVEFEKRFGCRAIGIDLVQPPLRSALLDQDRGSRIEFIQGNIEQLPIRTRSVDFVWCRDMLVHVSDVSVGLGECSRILRDDGKLLAWVTVETELMEPREAERLYAPLGVEAESMSKQRLEAAFAQAGFVISRAEMLGSELTEFYEERDGRASRELMRLARMRRMRETLIAQWGRIKYDSAYALYLWLVYLLLGKLNSGFYLLEKTATIHPAI